MSLSNRLRKLEARAGADACPECDSSRIKSIELEPGDPEPEPLPPCCPSPRVRQIIVYLPEETT